ncbi:N-acetylmuramoyl-L-alanine amidase-like domain-containing protein [uncultured Sunxiuqinia sp.]|uniref:N-acetylmuramoyl-L-alanine amidase-like domain-containing protein n=1 Tax=uncultured Sunxiuqinia sp. TaxID=1573825 RepID=UPI0026266C66|nr:N-acetylmuramoyl-L-alanine amidase-like domain-containing protein [uncultured Sunxiuqinia sp.]
MKKVTYLLYGFLFMVACQQVNKEKANASTPVKQHVLCERADSLKFESVVAHFSDVSSMDMPQLVAEVGKQFLAVPYVAQTLEHGEDEPLTIELEGLDCTTFAETALALARTLKKTNPDFSQFAHELETIRYRNGKREGYTSRLHYFSDWIFDNQQKGIVSQPASSFGQALDLTVNFMSTHPDSYPVLKANPKLVQTLAGQEKAISGRSYYFIPKEEVEKQEANLQEGDLVGLATSIAGLDVTHVGIVVVVNGRRHLMHASTSAMQVVISEEPLADFLQAKKSYTGLLVARPLD